MHIEVIAPATPPSLTLSKEMGHVAFCLLKTEKKYCRTPKINEDPELYKMVATSRAIKKICKTLFQDISAAF